MKNYDYINQNLKNLNAEVAELSRRIGCEMPKLVAVTKSGSDEELLALVRYGACAIGENRPGELARRGALLSDAGLFPELHEIGKLQSNKAKLVCDKATLIHSMDSLSLAKEVNKQGERLSRKIPVLIEINSAKEAQKSGVLPEDAERFLNSLLDFKSIEVQGLMTMGPALDDPEQLRQYFALTRELFDKFRSEYGFGSNPTLSMGMSDSYKVAIEEGSTLIRVGRKLFVDNQEV